MSAEHVEGYEPDAPRGWDALIPGESTARLWTAYTSEITTDRDRLRGVLRDLVRRIEEDDAPVGITVEYERARRLVGEPRSRQRDTDGGVQ